MILNTSVVWNWICRMVRRGFCAKANIKRFVPIVRQKMEILFLLGVIFGVNARAEPAVAFVNGDNPIGQKSKNYLSPVARDEGYVTITARINNPPGLTCVAPAANTFLVNKRLDVTITAQIFGFFDVDSKKEIPVATYSWNGENYCRSPWLYPIVLVPPTPIAVQEDASLNAPVAQPYIHFRLRSSSSDVEQVSVLAQALLGVSNGLFTGGAANTVVGLSTYAAGPAAKFLSDKFNSGFLSNAVQEGDVTMTWDDITAGVQPKQIQLVEKELDSGFLGFGKEEVQTAINKLHDGTVKGTPILTIDLAVDRRRSLFSADDLLDGNGNPQSSVISKYFVLNYPKKLGVSSDFPTLFERLNSEAPSLLSSVLANPGNECARVIIMLRDLGFNSVDRAIIMASLLEDIYDQWWMDRQFRDACLHTEPGISKRLTAIDAGRYPAVPPPPVNPELPLSSIPEWTKPYSDFMATLRLVLFSTGSKRGTVLKSIFQNAIVDIEPNLALGAATNATDPKGDNFLGDLSPRQIGCLDGYKDGNDMFGTLVFSAADSNGKISPYVLIVKEHLSADGLSVSADNLWIQSLDKRPGQDQIPRLKSTQYGMDSICYRGTAPNYLTIQDVLQKISK